MTKKRLIISIIFTISLGFSNVCFAYVTPDWEAIARNNARQNPDFSQYNYSKNIKNNKKQKISKKFRIDKKAIKKANKRQKSNNKKYKYSRQAELKRNALQKVR